MFSNSSADSWKMWTEQNKASRITSYLGPIFEKLTIKVPSDIIHTVSQATKDDILKVKRNSKVVVIPLGIDLSLYNSKIHQTEFQKFVLFIGRLVYYKNLNVIISYFGDVVKKLPVAKLVIVGDGPMRQQWQILTHEKGLDSNIEFMGYVSQQRKIELLSKCSALLLPSTFEGFGLVVLESFAMSKPVLVADVGPLDEIVSNGEDGYLIPLGDQSTWTRRITEILSDEDLCRKMGEFGRRTVEDKFNINTFVEKIEDLYKSFSKS